MEVVLFQSIGDHRCQRSGVGRSYAAIEDPDFAKDFADHGVAETQFLAVFRRDRKPHASLRHEIQAVGLLAAHQQRPAFDEFDLAKQGSASSELVRCQSAEQLCLCKQLDQRAHGETFNQSVRKQTPSILTSTTGDVDKPVVSVRFDMRHRCVAAPN